MPLAWPSSEHKPSSLELRVLLRLLVQNDSHLEPLRAEQATSLDLYLGLFSSWQPKPILALLKESQQQSHL